MTEMHQGDLLDDEPPYVPLPDGRWARWYGGLPVARKLRFIPGVGAVGLALVLVVTIGLGLAAESRLARLRGQLFPMVEEIWRLDQALSGVERGLQDAAATGDADDFARVDSLARNFRTTLTHHGSRDLEPEHQHILERFESYYLSGRNVSARLNAGETGLAITESLQQIHQQSRALRSALADDERDERAAIERAFAQERTWQRAAWALCLVLTLLSVVTLVILSRLASRSLTEPLLQAVGAAEQIASGDLDVRLPPARADEVGQLFHSMARMVVNLRASEDRLIHQAYHDPLTGLANRARFRDRVAAAEGKAGAGRSEMAVLYVDLDNFKDVNDALGHAVGDTLLVLVAERLLNCTRGCDTVARLGGDEFAILLRGVRSPDDAAVVADRVSQALATPFRLARTELRVGASIGIALGASAMNADDLLSCADMAMYVAKHGGKGRYRFFEDGMHAVARERLALETDLAGAVDRGELVLHYQPVVRLETGRIIGAEALLRWNHPERGLVSPSEFIPIAEETRLIVPIGRWVLNEACRQAAAWQRTAGDGRHFFVSVNISAWQVQHPGLVREVSSALAQSGLPPSALTLEVTESVLLTDAEATLDRLRQLKRLGLALAVDDFGSGYSSLGYLQKFPVDVLKIDKTFIDGVGTGDHDRTVTEAIVALGRALALRTVGEGIERAEQVTGLRALGCEYGQGYLFSRPVPAAELTRMLEARCVAA